LQKKQELTDHPMAI